MTLIQLAKQYEAKHKARETLAREYNFERISAHFVDQLKMIGEIPLAAIDSKLKRGKHLSFDEAFVGMTYVLAATNGIFHRYTKHLFEKTCGNNFDHITAIAKASAFLQAMAMKETLSQLTPIEIAGMAAAGSMDLVTRIKFSDRIMETCGMGGDRGFKSKDGRQLKTINVSTLTAIVLASLDIPTIKHGSYGNTTKIGSTEAIEMFGAKIDHDSTKKVTQIFQQSGFHFSDAHLFKTLHDLSHLLGFETVNHVVGPMTPPIAFNSGLYKIMGVNERIHPTDIAQAYQILSEKGIQKVGNVIVLTGLDSAVTEIDSSNRRSVSTNSFLDELSPFSSLISVVHWGEYLGDFQIWPEDFGIVIDAKNICFENERKILAEANIQALRGENQATAEYLAMNAALGLFCWEDLDDQKQAITKQGLNNDMLKKNFEICLEAITSGSAWGKLQKFIEISKEI